MAIAHGTDHPSRQLDTIENLDRQLRDYVTMTRSLVWQRQAIFLAVTLLAAGYYDATVAFTTYAAVVVTEAIELVLASKIAKLDRGAACMRRSRRLMRYLLANTLLNALAISIFVFSLAMQQPVGGHFAPLFFLFAAALFAAMNNHQVVEALIVRLSVYGVTFLGIAVLDILRIWPPLNDVLWLQFFTVLFVLYFIVDCSYVFLQLYRTHQSHLESLTHEHRRTKAAYKVKSEFVSTVSHELRTPLTSIKGSLDVINSGILGTVPAKMEPMLAIAGRNSGRLAALINDILDLQKIEAGEMQYRLEALEVGNLVAEAVESTRGFAACYGIVLDGPERMSEPLFVRGDEARLIQVLTNILSNAIKFSHEAGTVRVGYRQQGAWVRIFVRDDGIGIPAAAHQKVFEKFSQLDSSDQRKVGGTGLGMNITKQIVEVHGGRIDYDSVLGEGTTFYVDLHIIDPPAAQTVTV